MDPIRVVWTPLGLCRRRSRSGVWRSVQSSPAERRHGRGGDRGPRRCSAPGCTAVLARVPPRTLPQVHLRVDSCLRLPPLRRVSCRLRGAWHRAARRQDPSNSVQLRTSGRPLWRRPTRVRGVPVCPPPHGTWTLFGTGPRRKMRTGGAWVMRIVPAIVIWATGSTCGLHGRLHSHCRGGAA